MLVLNTDAHSTSQFDFMSYGVQTARRGFATPDSILNTRPLAALRKRLAGKRSQAQPASSDVLRWRGGMPTPALYGHAHGTTADSCRPAWKNRGRRERIAPDSLGFSYLLCAGRARRPAEPTTSRPS